MTAPDVAALAAALHAGCLDQSHGPHLMDARPTIAALAAQGARITFDWPPGTWHGVLPPSADDPVSAQAAPEPGTLPPMEWFVEQEHAAVRAELEGLRDDIDLLLASCTSTLLDGDRAKGLWQARDKVDARLAALDA